MAFKGTTIIPVALFLCASFIIPQNAAFAHNMYATDWYGGCPTGYHCAKFYWTHTGDDYSEITRVDWQGRRRFSNVEYWEFKKFEIYEGCDGNEVKFRATYNDKYYNVTDWTSDALAISVEEKHPNVYHLFFFKGDPDENTSDFYKDEARAAARHDTVECPSTY